MSVAIHPDDNPVAVIQANPAGTTYVPDADTVWHTAKLPLKAGDTLDGPATAIFIATGGQVIDGRNGPTGVTVRGVSVQGGTECNIATWNDWEVDSVDSSLSARTGIKGGGTSPNIHDSRIHHNARYGYEGTHSTDAVWENNEIDHNNTGHYPTGDNIGAGGGKLAVCTNPTMRGNNIHDNFGNGVWLDQYVDGGLVDSNEIYNNVGTYGGGDGVRIEISRNVEVTGNLIYGNPRMTIALINSFGCDVHDNPQVEASPTTVGVIVIEAGRTGTYGWGGGFKATDNTVTRNVVTFSKSSQWVGTTHYAGGGPVTGNAFVENDYYVTDGCATKHWKWWDGTSILSLPFAGANSWQSHGQDVDGSCQVGSAPPPPPTSTKRLTVEVIGCGGSTVISDPAGINVASGSSSHFDFDTGTVVVLTETPGPGCTFSSWSGGGTGSGTERSVTMDADATVTATFTATAPPVGTKRLSVAASGCDGASVVSDPAGIDVASGSQGYADFDTGTDVVLTAVPGAGCNPPTWSGAGTGTGLERTVSMAADRSVSAVFSPSETPPSPPPVGGFEEIHIVNPDGSGDQVIPHIAGTLNHTEVLDDASSCSFECPQHELVNPDNLAPGRKDIYVYKDGDLRWAGRLAKVRPVAGAASVKVQVIGVGWFGLLKRRLLRPGHKLKFVEVDLWEASRQVIDYANIQYPTGISYRLENKGRTFTETYQAWDGKTLADILVDIAQIPSRGYDFFITPEREWQTYIRPGGNNLDVVLEQGVNIVGEFAYDSDWESFANEVIVQGFGSGADTRFGQAGGVSLLDEYGLVQTTWRRPGLRKAEYLAEAAQNYLLNRAEPAIQPEVTITEDVDWNAFRLAEGLKVIYSDAYIDLNDYYRCVARSITYTEAGREDRKLTFDIPTSTLNG